MEKNINVKKRLEKVFNENELTIDLDNQSSILELDSLQIISLFVSIEDEFNMEIPDEFLTREVLSSFNDFYEMLLNILTQVITENKVNLLTLNIKWIGGEKMRRRIRLLKPKKRTMVKLYNESHGGNCSCGGA